MQLSLFHHNRPFPWAVCSRWVPQVGDLCQINDVILHPYGYVYMQPVRIISMDGMRIKVRVEYRPETELSNIYNGRIYDVTIDNLWPKFS